MRLEVEICGKDGQEGTAPLEPSRPVDITTSGKDELHVAIPNMRSRTLTGSRLILSWSQGGWLVEILHEGAEVGRIELPDGAPAQILPEQQP